MSASRGSFLAVKATTMALLILCAVLSLLLLLLTARLDSSYPLFPYDVLSFTKFKRVAVPMPDEHGETVLSSSSLNGDRYLERDNVFRKHVGLAIRCGYGMVAALAFFPVLHVFLFHFYPWLRSRKAAATEAIPQLLTKCGLCITLLLYAIFSLAVAATLLALGFVSFSSLRTEALVLENEHLSELWESFFQLVWERSRTAEEQNTLYDNVCQLQLLAKCSGGRRLCDNPTFGYIPGLQSISGKSSSNTSVLGTNSRATSGYRYCPRCTDTYMQAVVADFPNTCGDVLRVPLEKFSSLFLAGALVGVVLLFFTAFVVFFGFLRWRAQPGISWDDYQAAIHMPGEDARDASPDSYCRERCAAGEGGRRCSEASSFPHVCDGEVDTDGGGRSNKSIHELRAQTQQPVQELVREALRAARRRSSSGSSGKNYGRPPRCASEGGHRPTSSSLANTGSTEDAAALPPSHTKYLRCYQHRSNRHAVLGASREEKDDTEDLWSATASDCYSEDGSSYLDESEEETFFQNPCLHVSCHQPLEREWHSNAHGSSEEQVGGARVSGARDGVHPDAFLPDTSNSTWDVEKDDQCNDPYSDRTRSSSNASCESGSKGQR